MIAYYTVIIIKIPTENDEKLMRIISLLAGFITFLGSRAVGLSVPNLLFKAISIHSLISISSLMCFIIPSFAGVFAAWFILKAINEPGQENISFRFLLMIVSLIIMLFIDIYISFFDKNLSNQINTYLLPNLLFVLSIMLYFMANYKKVKKDEHDWNWKNT